MSTVELVPVTVAPGGFAHEVRAASVVWKRDLLRFWTDRGRLISSFMQPLLFLFVLGKGLGAALGSGRGGTDYSTFIFPGTLATGVMFTAVFSAISVVWDRELGFLREMLVAPVSRVSIIIGKCFGGASVATLQGTVLLALAGLVHVPYDPLLLLGMFGLLFLTSFAITAFGLLIAIRAETIQTVMPRTQLLLAPLMFLSGALFPTGGSLPMWLRIAVRVNPMSYAVDAMRSVTFHYLPDHGRGAGFATGLTWWGWPVPPCLDVIVVFTSGVVLLSV
ncbi:MAG: ABC transporter permease, partial [Frankiaceae bacterium]|nr:ABC transporter permease [Frankiaceae bacterium]